MEGLFSFFTWIAGWLGGLLQWVVDLFEGMFEGVWLMLKDFVIFIIETLLNLVVVAVGSFSLDFSAFNPGTYISGLPSEVTNILGLVGIPEAVAMIITALGIRFLLGLIPFVRVGG